MPGGQPTSGGQDAPAVLVIDDDESLRELYAVALRRAGFEVLSAASGAKGVAIVGAHQVGLVLCDLSMPGMSGFDVVRALRAAPDTATLPIVLVTGTGDAGSVIEGLAAGADDFLAKPIRIDELIARVRAHIRTRSAWLDLVQEELRARVDVVTTLARLRPTANPEEAAQLVVGELAQRAGTAFAAVFQVTSDNRGRILASTLGSGAALTALAPTPARMRHLIDLARHGPWTEAIGTPESDQASSAFWEAGPELIAGAPIFSGDELVGFLTMGRLRDAGGTTSPRVRDLLLATVIDYAAVLGAAIGPSLAARGASQAQVGRLREILGNRRFDAVFQPIVDLESRVTLGYEALTRFDDGVAPDARIAEAFAAGLGLDFELAAIAHAASRSEALPDGVFVAFNVSPTVLVDATDALRRALPTNRPVVIEVTEHVPIDDYRRLREAVRSLGDVTLAVDDAGAGFASMRHILELEPAYVKVDMSIVRGIHADELRQALAAGLVYYAIRSGFRLIAEGVEEQAEAEILQVLGVDLGQGYLFGRPGPPPG